MDLLEEIKLKSGLSSEDLKAKIDEKKEKFKDLLNDESAAFLVAKELGVEIDDSNISLVPLNIIDENSKGINVLVNVKRVFPKKTYKNKEGKEGHLQTLIVYDSTKEMPLTLWNRSEEVVVGDIYLVKNVSANVFRDNLGLSTSPFTEMKKRGHKDPEPLEKPLNKIDRGDFNVTTTGVVTRKNDLKEFEYNGETREVIRVLFFDNFTYPLVAWGSQAKKLNEIEENTKIKITAGYVKDNNGRLELHLTDRSTIEVLEKDVEVNTLPDEKKISDLAYDERVRIKGKVVEFVRQYNADVCETCNSKMNMKEGRFYCETCNDFKPTKKKIVLVYKIEDDSGTLDAVFFTKSAMAFLSADDSNIDDKINSFNDYGTEVELLGFLKKTDFADEFIVLRVMK